MHLKVLGRSIIILDSYQAAVDLLDKRGLVYSDRPKFTLYELCVPKTLCLTFYERVAASGGTLPLLLSRTGTNSINIGKCTSRI